MSNKNKGNKNQQAEQKQDQQSQQEQQGSAPDANSALDELNAVWPESVTLKHPHGFYDDDNNFRFWREDQIVTGADEIKLLIERKVPLKE